MTQHNNGVSGNGGSFTVYADSDLMEIIPDFLDNRRDDVTTIDGAVGESDFETIRVLGHDMKGSGGGYGFDGITDIGHALEQAARNGLALASARCHWTMVRPESTFSLPAAYRRAVDGPSNWFQDSPFTLEPWSHSLVSSAMIRKGEATKRPRLGIAMRAGCRLAEISPCSMACAQSHCSHTLCPSPLRIMGVDNLF